MPAGETILLNSLTKELDRYIREKFATRMSEYPPEFPQYTKTKPWPQNGGLFDTMLRVYQTTPQIQPAILKGEQDTIETQGIRDGRTKDISTVRFATGIAFSYLKLRSGIRELSSAFQAPEYLQDAMRMTLENYYVQMLADSMNTSAPAELLGFDGLPLVHTAHVLLNGDTASNKYPLQASVSYTVLHDLLTMMARIVSEDGMPYPMYRLNQLWIPPEEEANALEVLKAVGRPDTAAPVPNVLSSRMASGLSPSSIKSLLYMPNTQWFGVDAAKHTLTRFQLEPIKVEGPFIDERTEERWWKVTTWLGRTFWDWRGVIGVEL